MKLNRSINALVFLLLFGSISLSCKTEKYKKNKAIYINSYHRGHPSSDEIMDAIIKHLPADSFELKSYYMDTKRHTSLEFIEGRSKQLLDSILLFNPEVLIVSDDNAIKYLVKSHLDQLNMPIVFCGINWSDKEYNLPHNQVTGMLEVLPIEETLKTMKGYYPSLKNMLVLTENTTTSRKEAELLKVVFDQIGIPAENKLVNNFEEWKSTFRLAGKNYDIIYIPTHGAIQNWDHEEAIDVAAEFTSIPTVTCEDFMMPYVVFGMTKVASEQGIWAVETALEILKGKKPSDFPVTRNRQINTWLNKDLAKKINFEPDTSALVNFTLLK